MSSVDNCNNSNSSNSDDFDESAGSLMPPSEEYTPVVFLDTNAVHFASIVLAFANQRKIDLESAQWDAFELELQNQNLKHQRESFRKGYRILRYLMQQGACGAELYYSPITRLELICGRLRGEAIQRAAASGVPNRWYGRLDEREIRLQLEPDRYHVVKQRYDDIDSQFNDAGIVLNEQEIGKEIWQCARTMLECIFVDAQDCIVYASAFFQQADQFITTDRYLSSVVSSIQNPGGAPDGLQARFEIVQKALMKWCESCEKWELAKVIFPMVIGMEGMQKLVEGSGS